MPSHGILSDEKRALVLCGGGLSGGESRRARYAEKHPYQEGGVGNCNSGRTPPPKLARPFFFEAKEGGEKSKELAG